MCWPQVRFGCFDGVEAGRGRQDASRECVRRGARHGARHGARARGGRGGRVRQSSVPPAWVTAVGDPG